MLSEGIAGQARNDEVVKGVLLRVSWLAKIGKGQAFHCDFRGNFFFYFYFQNGRIPSFQCTNSTKPHPSVCCRAVWLVPILLARSHIAYKKTCYCPFLIQFRLKTEDIMLFVTTLLAARKSLIDTKGPFSKQNCIQFERSNVFLRRSNCHTVYSEASFGVDGVDK